MSATLLLGYLWLPSSLWLYLQSLVVSAAGLVAGPAAAFMAALLQSLGSWLVVSQGAATLPSAQVMSAVGMLWGTAAISWLASRNLYTALGWAIHGQTRAWQAAEEARQRRGELLRTLESLRTTCDLLERTSRELESARMEAEEARKIKARFVANISHELRTPLNIIVGFAETLCTSPESYGRFPWPSALREDLLAIWRNAEHLLKMVDDVLDLAQIEAARLPVIPELTDPGALIRETLQVTGGLLQESRLVLRTDLPEHLPALYLDRTRIRQVLLNLINNALRFTHRGCIKVGAAVAEEELTVYVRDSGEGIPSEKLETIFQEFEQVDTSLRRPHQGAGLGLAICRHFVRLHGGRIWAESELGEGSTFYFALPLPETRGAPSSPSLMRTRPGARGAERERKKLVVQCRDQLTVRMLQRHMEELEVLHARTVADTVSLARETHPAIVLMAAHPGESVEQARARAAQVRRELSPFDLPVVATSVPSETQAGLALDVAEFLIKPVTREQLSRAMGAARGDTRQRPQRVLIADDEPDMVRLLSRFVSQEWPEAEVLTATSGEEAAALAVRRPDLILLDLIMPGMSGVEVLEELKGNERTASIPVIAVSARGPAEDLASVKVGEMHVLRESSFTAGELIRVLESMAVDLPARYVTSTARAPDTPRAVPA
jgi:signal transduction histidine kinase/CheY-like chemotaxis protein